MNDWILFYKPAVMDDAFTTMPCRTQALYFMLGINSDKNGDCYSPKSTAKMIGASDEDLDELVKRGFIQFFKNNLGFTCVHVFGAFDASNEEDE